MKRQGRSIRFTKMHGLGNDFILVNCLNEKRFAKEGCLGKNNRLINYPDLAIKICDRHFGIGADGLLLIMKSKKADFRMRDFNPDGSEAEICGNGIRCFAKYVYEKKLTRKRRIKIETPAGIILPELYVKNGMVISIKIDMGTPRLLKKDIPMRGDPDSEAIGEKIEVDGRDLNVTCVSMGNPHCTIFVDDVNSVDVKKLGPLVEKHEIFPNKTNVEFIHVLNENEIKMRVWERYIGETLACGTGACAALVSCVLNNRTDSKITIHMLGGDLLVEWADDGHVYMTGPAEEVFTGEYPM